MFVWHHDAPAGPTTELGPLADVVARPTADTLVLATGARRLFVHRGARRCTVSDDPRALVAALAREGIALDFDPVALSHFLHHGFVPAPGTVYAEILRLSYGDELTVRRGVEAFTYTAAYRPPFRNALSRGEQIASTDRLLALLVDAVDHTVGSDSAVLMLSSGKDSVALALACAEAGRRDVRAVTFASDPQEDEARDAAAFARRLGLPHETVLLPDDRGRVEAVVQDYFEHASEPCGDPTLVPYLLGVAHAGIRPGEALIDGLNNDSYVGYVPSAKEAKGARIADRWLAGLRWTRGWFPPEHPVSAALRTRAEWHFFGGRWLRHADTRRFFPGSVDTSAHWQQVGRARADLDDFDFRAEVRGRHADQNAMIVKAYVAAECSGARAVFPYTDPPLVDYYFGLPESDRFDRAGLINKVLLRRLLRERLDYDDRRIGKRYFHFEGARFLTTHRAWVREEIAACPLWTRAVLEVVDRQLDRPDALRKTWPSILALFQLSGWLRRHG